MRRVAYRGCDSFPPIRCLTSSVAVASVIPLMLRLTGVVVLVVGLAACAGAPVQEMSDARQAIAAARAAGAPARSPDQYNAAQGAIERAEADLQQHDYGQARREAVEAKRDASAALALSQAGAH